MKENLVRDPKTSAIINTNSAAIRAAQAKKRQEVENKNRIDTLESDVSEIKDMLKQIVSKLNG